VHPILTQPIRLLAYVGAWMTYGLVLAGVTAYGARSSLWWAVKFWVPSSILLGFMSLSCWYLIKVLPARETPWPKLIGTWLGTGAVLISLWLAASVQWAQYLLPSNEQDVAINAAPTWALAAVIAFSIAILSHYLVAAFERSRLAEKQALQSKVLAREAELRSLRSQLDPHFLFNSLNSVAALIGTDVAAARRMCFLMAGFFRKSVALGKEESIPLSEEIQLIETFLAIEEVRFGDRLRKKFDVAEDTLKYTVPPLVLQPLVENAVHHGIAHLLEGGDIEVTGRLLTDQQGNKLLQLSVANACDPDRPPSKGTGTGLGNVRSRLDTLYGNTARVDATVEPTHYRVTLLLPAIAAPEPAKKP
jgi:two-component system sensor histidine kinase AlgZ